MTFSEKTARACGEIPIWACLAAFACLLALSVTMLVLSEKARTRARRDRLVCDGLADGRDGPMPEAYDAMRGRAKRSPVYAVLSTFCMTVTLLSMLGAYAVLDTYGQARAKGYVDGLGAGPAGLWDLIPEYPAEDDPPEDLSDAVIVYYKFGCEDCTATMRWIQDSLSGLDRVYYVSTRTDAGKKLTERYPVDEVPSAAYVRRDGTYLSYTLYTNDGKPSPNERAMDDLLSAVEYGRSH